MRQVTVRLVPITTSSSKNVAREMVVNETSNSKAGSNYNS